MRNAIPVADRVVPVNGTAASTTLEPLSVDIITAFQAYHWFEPAPVFAEADRIGRKRARFAAVWNERDDLDAFTRAYGETIGPFVSDNTEHKRRSSSIDRDIETFGWGPARVLEFRNDVILTWDALIGRARSTSYLPREGAAYQEMVARLRAIFDEAATDGAVHFGYVTTVHIGERMS
jgi:SAM-dependent methyltransferase